MKGKIQTRRDIFCGICRREDRLYSLYRQYMDKEARGRGWKFTKMDGWICPKCVEKRSRHEQTQ